MPTNLANKWVLITGASSGFGAAAARAFGREGSKLLLGARRVEILFQFLMEAAFLTSLGGLLGVLLGASIGWAVHVGTGD